MLLLREDCHWKRTPHKHIWLNIGFNCLNQAYLFNEPPSRISDFGESGKVLCIINVAVHLYCILKASENCQAFVSILLYNHHHNHHCTNSEQEASRHPQGQVEGLGSPPCVWLSVTILMMVKVMVMVMPNLHVSGSPLSEILGTNCVELTVVLPSKETWLWFLWRSMR